MQEDAVKADLEALAVLHVIDEENLASFLKGDLHNLPSSLKLGRWRQASAGLPPTRRHGSWDSVCIHFSAVSGCRNPMLSQNGKSDGKEHGKHMKTEVIQGFKGGDKGLNLNEYQMNTLILPLASPLPSLGHKPETPKP